MHKLIVLFVVVVVVVFDDYVVVDAVVIVSMGFFCVPNDLFSFLNKFTMFSDTIEAVTRPTWNLM